MKYFATLKTGNEQPKRAINIELNIYSAEKFQFPIIYQWQYRSLDMYIQYNELMSHIKMARQSHCEEKVDFIFNLKMILSSF